MQEMNYRRAAVIAARILEIQVKEKYNIDDIQLKVVQEIKFDAELSLVFLSKTEEVVKLKKLFKSYDEIKEYVENDKQLPILAEKLILNIEECKQFYVYLYAFG
jgi:hypothetical protein